MDAALRDLLLDMTQARAKDFSGTVRTRDKLIKEQKDALRDLQKQARADDVAIEEFDEGRFTPMSVRVNVSTARRTIKPLAQALVTLIEEKQGVRANQIASRIIKILERADLSEKFNKQITNLATSGRQVLNSGPNRMGAQKGILERNFKTMIDLVNEPTMDAEAVDAIEDFIAAARSEEAGIPPSVVGSLRSRPTVAGSPARQRQIARLAQTMASPPAAAASPARSPGRRRTRAASSGSRQPLNTRSRIPVRTSRNARSVANIRPRTPRGDLGRPQPWAPVTMDDDGSEDTD